jgi:hypothetical protein
MNEHLPDSVPTQPNWKLACVSALSDGIPLRSLYVALVVGTVLNLVNQGDAILATGHVSWVKIVLTYCVPYAVCTYGAVSSHLVSREFAAHPGTTAPKTRVRRA